VARSVKDEALSYDLQSHEFLTSEERLVHAEDLRKIKRHIYSLRLRSYSRCVAKLAINMSEFTAAVWLN
jgi:hypothetical protein